MSAETGSIDQEMIARIKDAQSFEQMSKIALEILHNSKDFFAQVCGPISTGGLGSVEKNLARFDKAIKQLKELGVHVFDQTPFEIPMQKLKKKPDYKPLDLLEGFYLPLLESEKINRMYFLQDWQSSFGARWEHEQAKRLGINVIYL